MNFFEHQEKARKQSRWIIAAFIGITLLIVLVIDILVLLVLGGQGLLITTNESSGSILNVFTPEILLANSKLLIMQV